MSGIEVAGLVLALIPLVIKAAKSCSENVEEGKKVFLSKDHKELKRELYNELYRELVLLNRHVRNLIEALADLSEERCHEILTASAQTWHKEADVVQALRSRLGPDFEPFDHAIGEVYAWIADITVAKSCQVLGAAQVRYSLHCSCSRVSSGGGRRDSLTFKSCEVTFLLTTNSSCTGS